MSVEIGLAWGGIVLLALGAAARSLALLKACRRCDRVTLGARIGAALLLAVLLVADVTGQGGWTPFDLRRTMLSLALATLGIHLLLTWRLGSDAAGPVVDLVALALTAVTIAAWPGSNGSRCDEQTLAYYIEWALLVLGTGATVVAGSAGLVLALRAVLAHFGRQLRVRDDTLSACVEQATSIALLGVGAGLLTGVFWTWLRAGTLSSGELRDGWMAAAWLVTAVSLSAWQLEKRGQQWAAGFALLAAAVAVIGLLVRVDLQSLLWA